MCLKILHKAEDKAIGRKEMVELALGIGIRRKEDHDEGKVKLIGNYLGYEVELQVY